MCTYLIIQPTNAKFAAPVFLGKAVHFPQVFLWALASIVLKSAMLILMLLTSATVASRLVFFFRGPCRINLKKNFHCVDFKAHAYSYKN